MKFRSWADFIPVDAQGISLHDVGVGTERQEVEVATHDLLRFCHHLSFGDPKGGAGHCHGEIIYLDTEELANADVDGTEFASERGRLVVPESYNLIFQLSQGDIGLCQEIT